VPADHRAAPGALDILILLETVSEVQVRGFSTPLTHDWHATPERQLFEVCQKFFQRRRGNDLFDVVDVKAFLALVKGAYEIGVQA
jgi:hypothetical protein